LQMYSKMGMVNCVRTGKNAQLFGFVTSFIISVRANIQQRRSSAAHTGER
jgi:hypothetical protein